MKYAIAEEFHSIQGEGLYTGVPMKFVRLAYCDVGCPWCDTDYSVHYTKYASEIVEDLAEGHLCITGGEPLQQDLHNLVYHAWQRQKIVHIETSGTIEIPDWMSAKSLLHSRVWITLSPKKNFLLENIPKADEVKLVVAMPGIDPLLDEFWEYFKNLDCGTAYKYLQPLNNVSTLNDENIRYALDLLQQHPKWRLSIQLQKVLGVR